MSRTTRYILLAGEAAIAAAMLVATCFFIVNGFVWAVLPTIALAGAMGYFAYNDIQALRNESIQE